MPRHEPRPPVPARLLMGYLKKELPSEEEQELRGLIEDYRQEPVRLIVPLALVQHYLRRHAAPGWVCEQVYLNPYPEEPMLRNHVWEVHNAKLAKASQWRSASLVTRSRKPIYPLLDMH